MTKRGRPTGPKTKQIRSTVEANETVRILAKYMGISMVHASHLLIKLGERYLKEEGLL